MYSGGLDICFDGKKDFEVEFQEESVTVKALIARLLLECNPKKVEFFVANNQIRPGILVLINDADWELEDKEEAKLHDKDRVSFISTLHGG